MRNRIVLIFLLLILLTACVGTEPTPLPTDTPSPTAGPTATSTPGSPLVILVLPADMPQDQYNLYQTAIYDLAQANGMRFQVRNSLSLEDISFEGSALKVVIALPPDPGLAALAAAAPAVQFLAVNIPGLAPAPNLSTLGADGVPADRQAFIAGYIAAMITQDYHIGLLALDDAQGAASLAAYDNGMKFYCGLCQKVFGPFYDYPIVIPIPTDELVFRYSPYAEPFVSYYAVEVVYVEARVATPELFQYMLEIGLYIISQDMPAGDLQSNWVASLKPDLIPAIQAIFPELLAGTGGQALSTPLVLEDVNPDLLSEGRQRLVLEALDDLQSGYIGTGINP